MTNWINFTNSIIIRIKLGVPIKTWIFSIVIDVCNLIHLKPMKKILKHLAILSILILSPYFKANELKAADGYSSAAASEETRTGIVISVSGLLFLDIAVVIDSETGAIYISEATRLDLSAGDTVSYDAPISNRIIIRTVIRK